MISILVPVLEALSVDIGVGNWRVSVWDSNFSHHLSRSGKISIDWM